VLQPFALPGPPTPHRPNKWSPRPHGVKRAQIPVMAPPPAFSKNVSFEPAAQLHRQLRGELQAALRGDPLCADGGPRHGPAGQHPGPHGHGHRAPRKAAERRPAAHIADVQPQRVPVEAQLMQEPAKLCGQAASAYWTESTRIDSCSWGSVGSVGSVHHAYAAIGNATLAGHMQDLAQFREALTVPLQAARRAFDNCDGEIAEAVWMACTQGDELVDGAVALLLRWATMFKELSSGALPWLVPALQQNQRQAAGSMMGLVQSTVINMKRMAEDIRKQYVQFLDLVFYLEHCAETSGDLIEMTGTDVAEDSGQRPQAARLALLASGREQLRSAAAVLDDCSDAWLTIHGVEREFQGMQKAALRLRAEVLGGGGGLALLGGVEELCSMLEGLSEHFI